MSEGFVHFEVELPVFEAPVTGLACHGCPYTIPALQSIC